MTAKSPKKLELLAGLVASGHPIKQAGKMLGMSDARAYQVSGLPEFREAVNRYRHDIGQAIVGSLLDAAGEAVTALIGVVRNSDSKPSDVIAASRTILQTLLPLQDAIEFRQRLDRLETNQFRKVG